ncbi:uncharacterized protein PAC_14194 [Phialocephala subalpina]|uniref:Enoyl reductase (ER) domain-containing protein n=1 Tax=Phialocephala subalpina TaxID=576137 RepID=A0A1L7XH68_9HELO|nr:uncharacterized protein PAC_14194 [Phialocephala subalpina]
MTSSAWQVKQAPTVSWKSLEALDHLHLNTSVPTPSAKDLGPKQVLVRIKAASINARDVMVIAHDPIYPVNNIEGLSPCADGTGEITAVGKDSAWKVGDRVLMHPLPGYTDQEAPPSLHDMHGRGAGPDMGMLRQFGIFEDAELFKAPEHLSYEDVAALPAAGATAVNSLFFGPVEMKPGMTILTQGTGGVSCALIQLATASGLTVISTSSSDAKLEIAKKLGAKHTINYKTHPDWAAEAVRITDGKGVDHVLDVAGDLEASLRAVRQGGLVSLIGFLDTGVESKVQDIFMGILFGGKIVRGVLGFNSACIEKLLQMTNEHKLVPLKEVFEWEDAKKAFERSMGYSVVGKIVIKV